MGARWGYYGDWVDVTAMLDPDVDYRATDLPVGVYLTANHGGALHRCFIVPALPDNDKGFWRYVYKGKRYRTLSAVARVITGDPTFSGNRFWGLRRRRRRKHHASRR